MTRPSTSRARRLRRWARRRSRPEHGWLWGSTSEPGRGRYNSLLYLNPDGHVAGVHRKLLPTGGERTVWGCGDGSTLTVVATDFGRIGGLICWENLMPLARAAMYQQGIDILLTPTWDNSDSWLSTLRHVAREGRVFVVGTNTCLHSRDRSATHPSAPGTNGCPPPNLLDGDTGPNHQAVCTRLPRRGAGRVVGVGGGRGTGGLRPGPAPAAAARPRWPAGGPGR